MMKKMQMEDERRERLKQMWQQEEEEANAAAEAEQMRQRKDSLVVEEKDVEYANADDENGPDNTTSAICSSSEAGNGEEASPELQDVKGRKTSTSKGSGKGHAQGHKVRRAKPLGGLRTHARQGSGASCSSSKTST